jgi:hypothetical protein
MADLTDAEIAEMIGDGTCTHLPSVRMAMEIRRRRCADVDILSRRIGHAPKCHQDPSRDSAWCAVHDECPDWHSDAAGYRGQAGFVCSSGGMVFDSQTSDAALRAYSQAKSESPE